MILLDDKQLAVRALSLSLSVSRRAEQHIASVLQLARCRFSSPRLFIPETRHCDERVNTRPA